MTEYDVEETSGMTYQSDWKMKREDAINRVKWRDSAYVLSRNMR